MIRLALLLLLLLAAPARAAPLTCAALAGEDAPNPNTIAALVAGQMARGGPPLLAQGRIEAIRDVLRAGCPGRPEARLADLAAAVPPGGAALDLGAMTCEGLAPAWRGQARVIVPFLAGWLAGPEGEVTRPAMDALAQRLQSTCRQDANAARLVTEVAGAIP